MPLIHNHKERLRKPLKRGGERGEDRWEEISYDHAMDEIAQKLGATTQNMGLNPSQCRPRAGIPKQPTALIGVL